MTPRFVLRLRKTLKRLELQPDRPEATSGEHIHAAWQAMLRQLEDQRLDDGLSEAEAALNRLR